MAERNPELPHQIVLRIVNNKTTVSCNCRREFGKHVRSMGEDSDYYKPMIALQGETIWDTYNKADNHWIAFEPSDRIRT